MGMDEKEAEEFQIGGSLYRLNIIFGMGFLQDPANIESPFYKSVFMECIIELHFLLTRDVFKEIISEINFDDDIPTGNKKKNGYNDIITFIAFFRHAVCHMEDQRKKINKEGQYISYTFQAGIKDTDEGYEHLCKYTDDIAAVFGKHYIYIKRHLVRIYKELSSRAFKMSQFDVWEYLLGEKKANL
jgi:hypothetical protein